MRRILWWFIGTVTVVVLMFGYHTSTAGPAATVGAQPAIVSGSSGTGSTGSTGSSGSTASAGSSSSSGGSGSSGSRTSPSASGTGSSSKTVTGDVADTRWGPVQVQLTVSGGKVTKVAVVQYPYNNGRDQEINDYALPILVKETTEAQSAQIDMVSGATVTSDGYVRSLQSALDKANL